MKIRTKLAIVFFVMVVFVVTAISVSIYWSSASYRHEDFYRRLRNRAINTALILIQVKEIDAALLMKMELDNPASLPMQFVTIYDSTGVELYSSDVENVMRSDTSFMQKVRRTNSFEQVRSEYEVLAFNFKGRNQNLFIVAGAKDINGLNALKNLRSIIFITFIFSLVIVSLLGWIFSGRVLGPISKIVEEVDSITAASLSQRVNEGNGKDELSKLAQTFNRMLSRLEAAFLAQRNFIANVSHELRTPFTVMAGEIEVTLLHSRDNQYYLRILKSVLEGIKRFNKLSTQLLLLAQTSADLPQKRFNPVRIDDFLWEAKKELESLHPEYQIEILFDLNLTHDSLIINGDELLIKILLMNLMDNACKYSDESSAKVTLTSLSDKMISIEFINTGNGIDEAELNKVFEPFYRGKLSKKVNGFGVGLSLAANITSLHKGNISVASSPGAETRFTITLPIHRAHTLG
jgi:signal transduction histidine kinase